MAKDFAEIERMEAEAGLQATDGELTSEAKQSLTSRFVAQWEKKNARRAIRGGVVSTMALTLAACGDDDDDTDTGTQGGGADETTPTAQTFTLTTSIDDGEDFTGGAGDDRFEQTKDGQLSIDDSLDGGEGADELIIRDQDGATGKFTATNIETIDVRSKDGSTATVDLDNVTGYTTLVANAITDNTTFSEIKNASDLTLTVKNVSDDNTSDSAKFVFVKDTLKGSGDTVDVELASNSGKFTLSIDDSNTSGGIETLNINSSADNAGTVTLGAEALRADKIVVTGAGDLDLTGAALSEDVTVDAGAAGGDLKVEVDDKDVTLTGGSGDDLFDFGTTTLDGKDTVDGGTGTNELRIGEGEAIAAGALTGSDAPSISNIDTLFVDQTLSDNLDVANFGAANIKLSKATSQTVDNLIDGGSVTLGGETGANNLTLQVKDALKAGENANSLDLNLGDGDNGSTDFDLKLPGLEVLTIDTTNALSGKAGTRKIDLAAGDDDLETITVKGDNAANFDVALDGGSLETINASALTAALTVDVNGVSQGVTITGGSKGDTVTGGNGADVIKLGAGDDTVTIDKADAVNDTVDGEAGSDTIKIANGIASGSSGTTIDLTDLDGSTLDSSDAFDNFSNFDNIDASAENTGTDDFKLVGNANANILKGGAGDDEIEGGAGNDIVDGAGGADTITLGSGDDELVYDAKADGGDTIKDFSVGDDFIDIDNLVTNGGTYAAGAENTVDVLTGGDYTLSAGVVIVDNGDADIADADGLTKANIADRLNDLGNDGKGDTNDDIVSLASGNDDFIVAISDGTDTAVVHMLGDGTNTDIATGDLTVLATLKGVADAGTLTAANFDGFA